MKKKTLSVLLLFSLVVVFSCNREQNDFEKAKKENTVQAFEEFVLKYPDSEFAASAKAKIDSLQYEAVISENNLESYREFIQSHPDHPLALDAKQRMEPLVFEEAKNKGTAYALESFLAEYPDNSKRDSLIGVIEKLYLKTAFRCESGMPSGIFTFLSPGSLNITFAVTSNSMKDNLGHYGNLCGLKIRQTVTVLEVKKDGLLILDKEGVEASDENNGINYISKKVGTKENSPILFVPVN
jgi:hypothetical protein